MLDRLDQLRKSTLINAFCPLPRIIIKSIRDGIKRSGEKEIFDTTFTDLDQAIAITGSRMYLTLPRTV